ncbi:hypothetical protein TYRP_021743 [Tyrophagus putrescentiae]|nr:hypothetical protein TYRP_021743 [Tyrophagus putrescentiae]
MRPSRLSVTTVKIATRESKADAVETDAANVETLSTSSSPISYSFILIHSLHYGNLYYQYINTSTDPRPRQLKADNSHTWRWQTHPPHGAPGRSPKPSTLRSSEAWAGASTTKATSAVPSQALQGSPHLKRLETGPRLKQSTHPNAAGTPVPQLRPVRCTDSREEVNTSEEPQAGKNSLTHRLCLSRRCHHIASAYLGCPDYGSRLSWQGHGIAPAWPVLRQGYAKAPPFRLRRTGRAPTPTEYGRADRPRFSPTQPELAGLTAPALGHSRARQGHRSVNMPRPRDEIISELEAVAARLQPAHNAILQNKMERLIKELDRANRERSYGDSDHRRKEMQFEYLEWATRHQQLADREKNASKAIASMPRETPVNFTGENARAFWAHFTASVINNKALDNRQRMAHLLSRVKDHRDGAALVAGFNPDGSELEVCLHTFQAQYLDDKVLKVAALKRAQEVTPLTNTDDQLAVAAFISEVRTLQTSLKSEEGDQQYIEVARILVAKLPVPVRRQFCRRLAKESQRGDPALSEKDSVFSKSSESRQKVPILALLVSHLETERGAAGWWRYLQSPEQKEAAGDKRRDHSPQSFPAKRFVKKILVAAATECQICTSRGHRTEDCKSRTPEERNRIARRAGLCLKCLQHLFTPGQACPNAKPCSQCAGQHHQAVCVAPSSQPAKAHSSNHRKGVHVATNETNCRSARVYMSTIAAVVHSGGQQVPVRVLLDSAAETSLVTEEAVRRTRVKCCTADTLTLTGITEGLRRADRLAQFTLAAADGSFSIDMAAYVAPKITSAKVMTPASHLISAARAKGINLARPAQGRQTVDILIGQDWLFPFLAPEIVPLGPFIGALRTRLGWYVAGREGAADAREAVSVLECQKLCQDLAKIYEYVEPQEMTAEQSIGTPVEILYDEKQAVYTVGLPKRATDKLADNFRNAWAQVMALRRKLKATGQYDAYDEVIKEYITKGYAEVAPKGYPSSGTYTIPHHAVWRKEATKTKCRVVFNASSTVPGQLSLNQCLEKGEPINADIWAVTMRFRLAPIVLVTDLVKAFSQIQIKEEDRDLLRYLWFDGPDDASPTVYRMKSVIFGAICSPHILGAVLQDLTHRFREEFPEVAEQMSRSMYMDDGIFVANSPEQAIKLMSQAEAFFAKASFALHPWLTDSKSVMTEERQFGCLDEDHKCLGLKWHPGAAEFRVKPVTASLGEGKTTRRQALAVLSKFYDPVSLFAPLKTAIRLFIRNMASAGVNWDDAISEDEAKSLKGLLRQLEQVAEVSVPRGPREKQLIAVHVFGDASPQAYGIAIYLADAAGEERMLLGAQVKLAPKKFVTRLKEEQVRATPSVTLPRLELMAAVMAARLTDQLLLLMPRETPVAFYTDSDITLKRIQGDPNKQEPFEMRRLQIIGELSDVAQWHHITTKQNPADLLTRDCTTRTWLKDQLWWKGPDATIAPLAVPRERVLRQVCVSQVSDLTEEEVSMLQESYSSALQRMKELVLKETSEGQTVPNLNEGKERPLDAERYAALRLMKLLQQQQFPRELERLTAGRPLVRDLVREEHRKLGHAGEANTRSHLAQYYHILGARQLIKSVVRPCRECNIQRGKAFNPPEPTLPSFRTMAETRPFTNIGIDYWGPLKVKGSSKVYGLLITCAVTRAVHLEVVTSLAAKQCLNALTRFFARRGVPAEIHSDNATTFDAVNKALAKLAANVEELSKQTEMAAHQIRWTFQTPKAPWFGAFFERMVGVTKKTLQQTSLRKASAIDDIRTIVTQVEALVNSRPLIEADDSGIVALTPAHFLVGTSLLTTPPLPSVTAGQKQGSLLEHYRAICEERSLLRKRLQTEYLIALRKHHRVTNPTREPRLGEQVLIAGEEGFEKDRFAWPIVQIVELKHDPDGHVRRVMIRRGNSVLERPVKSLIPLEGVSEAATPPGPGNVADAAKSPISDDGENSHAGEQS